MRTLQRSPILGEKECPGTATKAQRGVQAGGGQTRQPEVSVAQVAKDIGVSQSQLFRWRRELEGDDKAFPGSGVARDQELLALKRELAKVKRERGSFARRGSVLRQRVEVK